MVMPDEMPLVEHLDSPGERILLDNGITNNLINALLVSCLEIIINWKSHFSGFYITLKEIGMEGFTGIRKTYSGTFLTA